MDVPAWDTRELTVGQLAARSGVTVSALHFYERQGLISSRRTTGNQRRYRRDMLRRVACIRTAHEAGIPLADIGAALDELPDDRVPREEDWQRMSDRWKDLLDARVRRLQQLRDEFTDCIGCGCLSLAACATANPNDELGSDGPGPRLIMLGGPPAPGASRDEPA